MPTTKLNYLVEDIPFDELAGIKIEEAFESRLHCPFFVKLVPKVSVALTTNCPICNGTIQPGQSPAALWRFARVGVRVFLSLRNGRTGSS